MQIQDDSIISRSRLVMATTGYAMLLASSFIFLLPTVEHYTKFDKVDVIPPPPPSSDGIFVWFMQYYGFQMFAFLGAVFLAIIGFRLLGSSSKTLPRVIPMEDRELLEPLVREANRDAINQYVILSSLSGFTGTFQKIGFSGLPLATVTLTLFFCALSFLKPEFIEFAKLTLGAFIGSFVQRGTDANKLPSINWENENPPRNQ